MRRVVVPLVLAVLATSTLPAGATGQGFAVGPKLGSTGLGADVIVSLAPKLALKGGVGFSLGHFDLDLGCGRDPDCTTYRVEPPPMFLTGAIDIRLAGPVRIMAGLLYRSDDTHFGGDLDGPSLIGDETFSGPGRLDGALVSAETAPFLGIGFGSLGGTGFKVYLDVALAFAGDPDVELMGSGAITSEAGFAAALERERLRILDDIDNYYQYWPVVNLGFRFGI
jgi:hypothetical protein